jgi:nucleotide-binding universal stress UspA family protein
MKTLLVPVDFSKISETVVTEAAALARALDGRVVLLTVVQPPLVFTEFAAMMNVAEITAASEKYAAHQLERFEDKLRNQFVKTESLQLTGAPIAHIVEQAEKFDADYIVMGSHGHTALYDLLVGSTTHGVLMRARCPVIVVPAAKPAAKPGKTQRRTVGV